MRALLPEATAIVKNSSSITIPELGKTLKATMGCGDIGGRTLHRLRQVVRKGGNESENESYTRLANYLEQLKATSGGTITDCQVNCIHVLAYEASKAPTESLASMNKLRANKEAFWKGLNDAPHKLWANYADRRNMTWNKSTSNMLETVNSMIGPETRANPVTLMLHNTVLKTANRMATAACVSGDDSLVVPFAHDL